jgi:predicted transcriptional regulator
MKAAEIARKYGVSQSAVSQRLKQLNLSTTAALVAPQESTTHVRRNLDVMEQLARNVVRANLLQDACDEWLRDAEDPTKYDLGARADEVEVTYEVELQTQSGYRQEKRKKKLSHLMACLEGEDEDGARFCGWKHGEYKRADPRELILKTQQETRQTAALVIDAIQKLTDSRIMEDFRKAVIEEVAKESPDCAARIEERLQRSIVLHAAFARPGTVSASGATGEPN